MLEINPGVLLVPRGLPNLSPLELDIGVILEAESRIQEIAVITVIKAPELMAAFNCAYSELVKMSANVEFEYELAKKHLNEVKAVILLDKIPQILKDKGLATTKSPTGSEDLRQAILDTDSDYRTALDRVIQLKCIVALLDGKAKTLDMAYTAAKKVYSDSSQYRHSPDLSVAPQTGFFKPSKF